MSQEMPAGSRCWEGKEADAPLQPQKGCSPVNTLTLVPRICGGHWSYITVGKFLLLFEATQFIVIRYSRNRKQIPQREKQSRGEV